MLRRSIAAFLFILAATPLSAAVLVPGPERLLGDATLRPWLGQPARARMATDGNEIAMFWLDEKGDLFAVRLDREGRTLTPLPRRLLERIGFPRSLRAVWHDGHYVVFFTGQHIGLQRMRLTRDLEIVDLRKVSSHISFDAIEQVDGEIVIFADGQILRLRGDLTPAGPPLVLPERATSMAAAGNGRYVLLILGEPVATLRTVVDGTPGELKHVELPEPRSIHWTGSELLLHGGLSLQRLDRNLEPIGAPVKLTRPAFDLMVTPLGDGTFWLQWWERDLPMYSSSREYGLRYRPGVPFDLPPIETGVRDVVPIRTSDDRVLLADPQMRIAGAPPRAIGTPLTWTPAAFRASAEMAGGAGASPTELAAVRGGMTQGGIIAVMNHQGTVLREIPIGSSAAAIATDGKDLFAFDRTETFRSLAPGARPVKINGIGHSQTGLAWTGSEFATAWSDWFRSEPITVEGRPGLPCAVRAEGADAANAVTTLAAGNGEALLAWAGRMAWFRNGCPTTVTFIDPLLARPHELSWQDGRWAIAVMDGEGTLRIGFTHRGPFRTNAIEVARDAVPLAFVPASGGWALLYVKEQRNIFAASLDANGNLVAEGLVAREWHDGASIVPLPDGRLAVVYTRVVREAPFFNVTRAFLRFVTVEADPSRRRGVRH